MVNDCLTNIYYHFCGNRKDNQVNSKMKIYCHPFDIINKRCSTCCAKIKNPKHVSKIWTSFHVFCKTECYNNWLIQFN